ncbi:hypothetical protein [Nonomuraea sp. GTA35]|uniref:hypothetical protein n=1 Tax=Nonomuraea sp. GTA35 TaxID=1676746 RepID=UPI0035C08BFC
MNQGYSQAARDATAGLRVHAGGLFLVSRLVMSVIAAMLRWASLCDGLRPKSTTLRREFIDQDRDLSTIHRLASPLNPV